MKTLNNRLTFKIKDFFDDFEKNKLNCFEVESKSKKKITEKITFQQYKLIVKTFFKIYFYELFFTDKIVPFFLGGLIQRVKTTEFVNKKNVVIPSCITALWFNRPSNFLLHNCAFVYRTGTTNLITYIRKDLEVFYKKNYDHIPSIYKLIELYKNNFSLVKHEQRI